MPYLCARAAVDDATSQAAVGATSQAAVGAASLATGATSQAVAGATSQAAGVSPAMLLPGETPAECSCLSAAAPAGVGRRYKRAQRCSASHRIASHRIVTDCVLRCSIGVQSRKSQGIYTADECRYSDDEDRWMHLRIYL